MNEELELQNFPKEMFEFANQNVKLNDEKFDTKPIGYFKDAFIRFRKNKASVIAFIIIVCIVLFAFLIPWTTTNTARTTLVTYYAKKGPRVKGLKNSLGIFTGGVNQELSEAKFIYELSKGVAAEFTEENPTISLAASMDSEYQPVIKFGDAHEALQGTKMINFYDAKYDTYLSVGFLYKTVEQEEYQRIIDWEKQTGKKVIYPLIAENEYVFNDNGATDGANYWYKTDPNPRNKLVPVVTTSGTAKTVKYSENLVLEENYMRDADGNYVYHVYAGGGSDISSAMYKVRVLYYNYYQYLYGSEPNYVLGTDYQGYDLAIRMANGIKLSLAVSVVVSVINFLLGTIYGACEGYYGGATDLILERISDILANVPFIVVASLFQLHLAAKVGKIPSLLFAFIATGWIGTASLVRMQFYRFKNQEYVMSARTLGARDRRIMWKHIYPNTLGTIITSSVLVIPGVIFSESMLSFLGIVNLGGSTSTSLGTLLSEASGIWNQFPHLMLAPGVVISLLMICFNLFGNGLRDAFNPTLRGAE